MDFGWVPIVVFFFLLLGLAIYLPVVLYKLVKRDPLRANYLWGLVFLLGAVTCVGLFDYKVFYLDEGLCGAAISGDVQKAKLLLSRGADPEAEFEGETALESAKRGGHKEIVDLLKKAGAKK